MQVYFLGNYVNKKFFEEKLVVISAAMKWQYNLVNSLKKIASLSIYTEPLIPIYPKSKFLIIPNKDLEKIKDNSFKFLKYINLPFVREIMIGIYLFFYIFFRSFKQKDIKVLQYNLNISFSIPMFLLEKLGCIKYVPIVLDLYPFQKNEKSTLRNYINYLNFFFQTSILKRVGKSIIINENIAKDFSLKNYLLVEGGITEEDFAQNEKRVKISSKKIIVFTGGIDNINGIEFAINSFDKLKNHDVELHFYGNGKLISYIQDYNKINSNIKYMGYKINDEILKIQREADFLIIPRKKSLLNLRYTFPSKLFEYMLSGTPVICTDIPGLTEEYKENLFVVDTENENEFAEFIEQVLNKNEIELKEKSQKAQKFILENKSWDKQAQRIIEFLKRG